MCIYARSCSIVVFFSNLMRFFALLATYVLISRITFAHIGGAYVRDIMLDKWCTKINGVQWKKISRNNDCSNWTGIFLTVQNDNIIFIVFFFLQMKCKQPTKISSIIHWTKHLYEKKRKVMKLTTTKMQTEFKRTTLLVLDCKTRYILLLCMTTYMARGKIKPILICWSTVKRRC